MAFNFFNRKKSDDETVKKLPTDAIVPNRFQPRKVFQEEALNELALTIKQHGLLQPIVVREYDPGRYEIIAGERRFRAVTTQLAWTEIPAIVTTMADDESAAMALIENLQRADLSPIEEAQAYSDLMSQNAITQEGIARRVGKSQSFVANKLRLLKLSQPVQAAIMNGSITERQGRAMLKLDDHQQQDVLNQIAADRLNVKETEALVQSILAPAEADEPAEEQGDQPQAKTPAKKPRRRTALNADTRVAVNTIKKSLKMVQQAGMDASMREEDADGVHRIIIEIPDQQQAEVTKKAAKAQPKATKAAKD
ncbi:nucleoid occlusion protein [Lacticaseibacillus pantheris]|jgi:ParB family chromosome partitioning protein|uniref:Nucleoid occlusion protein n=1 Tax=Lacticaseibacillus pantheris DSM 15945 = JCM 12539 = NBRC 106106 TaxID=1423783 RepID=A0A0R1U7W1_9LACO|nr:nucleoid occlusion protein [Lacticaseibacillus pantheris]KRL87514.1 nucleoid occlusion protein [Lacticaseibacillus pantheris DSM 15945 = JCM 12539 = NBRC 106106]WKF85140.1 nucleoid occlusion protein [Lacticaseibacillus pantheris]